MLKIESVSDLQVGDVGFSMIGGRLGASVSFGQWLIDAVSLIRGRRTEQGWFTHTYIVIDAPGDDTVRVLEAMPHGARAPWIGATDRIGPGFGWARVPLTPTQAATMATSPRPGYSFLDYLSLALLHLGLPRAWLAGRVTSSGHMICSQLVDAMLTDAGFSVFDDGRLPQDVTPGALFHRLGAIGEVVWW